MKMGSAQVESLLDWDLVRTKETRRVLDFLSIRQVYGHRLQLTLSLYRLDRP